MNNVLGKCIVCKGNVLKDSKYVIAQIPQGAKLNKSFEPEAIYKSMYVHLLCECAIRLHNPNL